MRGCLDGCVLINRYCTAGAPPGPPTHPSKAKRSQLETLGVLAVAVLTRRGLGLPAGFWDAGGFFDVHQTDAIADPRCGSSCQAGGTSSSTAALRTHRVGGLTVTRILPPRRVKGHRQGPGGACRQEAAAAAGDERAFCAAVAPLSISSAPRSAVARPNRYSPSNLLQEVALRPESTTFTLGACCFAQAERSLAGWNAKC